MASKACHVLDLAGLALLKLYRLKIHSYPHESLVINSHMPDSRATDYYFSTLQCKTNQDCDHGVPIPAQGGGFTLFSRTTAIASHWNTTEV